MSDELMMMAFGGFRGSGVVSQQKLVEGRLLKTFFFRLGVECFHLVQFLLRELRQMADKMHQLPAIEVLLGVDLQPERDRPLEATAYCAMKTPLRSSVREIGSLAPLIEVARNW